MASLASDWLRHLISPLKPLNRIQRNLTGSKISTLSTKFVFFGAERKNKMAALASDWLRHLISPLKPLNGIQRNLTGSKISTSSTKFLFFGPISNLKQKCPPWQIPLKGGTLYSGARYVAPWVLVQRMRQFSTIKGVIFQQILGWKMPGGGSFFNGGQLTTLHRIQGGTKIGYGGLLLQRTHFLDWKATGPNRIHSSDLEACGKNFFFCSIPKSNSRRILDFLKLSHFDVF